MSSCPTGTQDFDQLSPGAWARKACRRCGTWSEASVGSEYWSDVVPRSCSCNKSGCGILDTLKWINRRLWKVCEDWVTVVKPGCHEGWHQAWGNLSTDVFMPLPTDLYPAKSAPSERPRLVRVIHFEWAIYWRMCKSCVTYIHIYLLDSITNYMSSHIQNTNKSTT